MSASNPLEEPDEKLRCGQEGRTVIGGSNNLPSLGLQKAYSFGRFPGKPMDRERLGAGKTERLANRNTGWPTSSRRSTASRMVRFEEQRREHL